MLTPIFLRFIRIFTLLFIVFYTNDASSNNVNNSIRPSLLDGIATFPKAQEVNKDQNSQGTQKTNNTQKISKKQNANKNQKISKKQKTSNNQKNSKKQQAIKKTQISKAKKVKKATQSKNPKNTKKNSKKYAYNKAKKAKKTMTNINKGLDLNKFPKRYNHWLLDVVNPEHFGKKRCVLRSNTTEIEDGYLQTPIFLEVFSDLIKVSGKSPIDLSYGNLGIKVDTFDRVSIDAIASETNALFFLELSTLVSQMKRGDKLDIALGFWPVASLDKPYSAEVSLSGFANGIKKLNECEKKLSKLSI